MSEGEEWTAREGGREKERGVKCDVRYDSFQAGELGSFQLPTNSMVKLDVLQIITLITFHEAYNFKGSFSP